MNRLRTILVLAAAVLAGYGTTQTATASTHSFHGVVVDRSDGSQAGNKGDPTCANDTYTGSSVVVSNQNGQFIGSAMLSNGVVVDAKADPYNSAYILSASCGYKFTTTVPTGSTFYGVKIGSMAPVEISAATVRAHQWTVMLTVGKPCYIVGIQKACGG